MGRLTTGGQPNISCKRQVFSVASFITLLLFTSGYAKTLPFELNIDGSIPIWLVAGPFEQKTVGFGDAADLPLIDESSIPYYGKDEFSFSVKGEKVRWNFQSADEAGYLDFNDQLALSLPSDSPAKINYADEAYASATVESPVDQDVLMLAESNSRLKIQLNSEVVYNSNSERSNISSPDTVHIHLNAGDNHLLLRVGNSHRNLIADWFGGVPWGWGFRLRLIAQNNRSLKDVNVNIGSAELKLDFDIRSTFFFKQINDRPLQRIDVILNIPSGQPENAILSVGTGRKRYKFNLSDLKVGQNRRELYIPEVKKSYRAKCRLDIGELKAEKRCLFESRKRYVLCFVPLSHMDIGYTNTQPIVKERHVETLRQVVQQCEDDPDFRWTIETLWILEAFEESVSSSEFKRLVDLIKAGTICVSPLYSNPYTGWISYSEMIRTFDKTAEYHRRFGFDYPAAIINDTPGATWILPQMLQKVGTQFLAFGLNEIYQDYKLQKNLPKVFNWQGSDKSRVVCYLTNAYTEGRSIGLEKDTSAIKLCLWKRLNKLEMTDYPYELVLLNSAFSDNSGIPKQQYESISKWNDFYTYPKIITSTLAEFSSDFLMRYKDKLPLLKGDWTSDWDVLYQGEPEQFIEWRKIQHKVQSVEKLATINWLKNPSLLPFQTEIENVYRNILQFSGHGSGLEFGFGSPEENRLAMRFRRGYIQTASLLCDDILERSLYRYYMPHASFKSEGVIVWNGLSWKRNAVVELYFPKWRNIDYDIMDLNTQTVIPAIKRGHSLTFIARDLPALGHRKYTLIPSADKESGKDRGLSFTNNSIENQYYRIHFDLETGGISEIVDKKSGSEITLNEPYSFNGLVMKRGIDDQPFQEIQTGSADLKVIDERPLRFVLRIDNKDQLLERTEYVLWNGLDRVDINHCLNMERLLDTEEIEEYGIVFPFNIQEAETEVEILGGFLNPETDRFPVKDHNAFSFRRVVYLSDQTESYIWASADRRVARIGIFDSRPVMVSNVVNNFPEQWNRHQENQGLLELRYSFTHQIEKFSPAKASRFGWEFLDEPLVRQGWMSASDPLCSYFGIDNENIIILGLKMLETEGVWRIELLNVNPESVQECKLRSDFLRDKNARIVDGMGNCIRKTSIENGSLQLRLGANHILYVNIE